MGHVASTMGLQKSTVSRKIWWLALFGYEFIYFLIGIIAVHTYGTVWQFSIHTQCDVINSEGSQLFHLLAYWLFLCTEREGRSVTDDSRRWSYTHRPVTANTRMHFSHLYMFWCPLSLLSPLPSRFLVAISIPFCSIMVDFEIVYVFCSFHLWNRVRYLSFWACHSTFHKPLPPPTSRHFCCKDE